MKAWFIWVPESLRRLEDIPRLYSLQLLFLVLLLLVVVLLLLVKEQRYFSEGEILIVSVFVTVLSLAQLGSHLCP